MTDLLTVVPAIRCGVKCPNGAYKSERHFFDFAINGHSLWQMVGKSRDMVSILCREFVLGETIKTVNRVLLTEGADLPDNRRSLFICAECGDIGCGAITLRIVREGDAILWKDLGFENDYQEHVDLDSYRELGPFTFDAAPYERVLLRAIDSLKLA
jgi:hypothetical protein